ncbi:33977_t:CDS:2, partial [Gigaspora margarita]
SQVNEFTKQFQFTFTYPMNQIYQQTNGSNYLLRQRFQVKSDEDLDKNLWTLIIGRAKTEIVVKIKHRLEFEEYPETSEDGVAYIYNVAGMDTEKALEIFDLKNIQYSYKDRTTRKSVYCLFLTTKVYKETRTCRGIKMCQFAAPELVTMMHTSVHFANNLFKKIFEANELSSDTNTLNAFAAAHKVPCGFIFKPVLDQEGDTSTPLILLIVKSLEW